MPVGEAHRLAVESRYSRFPIMRDNRVVGIASARSLGRALYSNSAALVGDVALDAIMLAPTETAASAFNHLQAMGRNMAVVVDEKGNFLGLVTLEDLLEELVGEIN